MTMNIENILGVPAMKQYEGLATSPDGKSYICTVCGPIDAKMLNLGGKVRYIRQECACERQLREAHSQAERERAMLVQAAHHTYSWLGDRYADTSLLQKSFATFDASRQQVAFQTVQNFLDVLKGSLVLHGTFGTGKTHLLAALCNQALKDLKYRSLFTTAPKFFAAIQARIQADEDYSRLITYAINTPLLVIDDIDKAKPTDFREQTYFEIINERVNAGKPTAISTNKLSELAHYVGGAVCSRLKVGQIEVEMIGEDYREKLEA